MDSGRGQPHESTIAVAPNVALRVRRRAPGGASGGRFLLVHGLASNALLWDGVARELHRLGHESAAVDLRGHGLSGKPDDGYDFQTVTDDLLAVIAALGWERPIVVGQSWGGNLAMELAWRAPDAVAGIAAIDGGTIDLQRHYPQWPDCARALRPPELAGMPAADLERRLRDAHPDWPEEGIAGTMGNFRLREDGTIEPWLTLERHLTILRGLWEHHPETRYPEIGVPVLLIPALSEASAWSAERQAATQRALAALPRARSVAVAGDHDLHAQYPSRVAELLDLAWIGGFWS